MSIRTNIILRVYFAFGLVLTLALSIVWKMVHVQLFQKQHWEALNERFSMRYVLVAAARGNIFSADGGLLATSLPEYELRMDLLAACPDDDRCFNTQVVSLAIKLADFFRDKSAPTYLNMLKKARLRRDRYLLIKRTVSYQQLEQVRQFPIFRLGRYKGGLIVVQKNKRMLPFGSLAARTIGHHRQQAAHPIGLEGAYADYIRGESGIRLVQRIAGNVWIPIQEEAAITPKDGADIVATIDINLQDIAQDALRKQLIKSDADHGCVVLMEVHTGEVKAIVNQTRIAKGLYEETFNYAIAESAEPGSTFKLASYMALLEHNKVDLHTPVDCEGGLFRVYNHTIKDTHLGVRTITVKEAFEKSSNVAIAKLIYQYYKDQPKKFIRQLHRFHLNEQLQLQIPGEGVPFIKNPKSKWWTKLTLAQMAYGYESKLTPLQMLTFYNAVANNGKMIAPIFVREIKKLDNTIAHFQARVITSKICSDATLHKVQQLLKAVVESGTGMEAISNSLYTVAGKTGTAQIANKSFGYGKRHFYQSSFCGYFPADKPKYSMIVVVSKPQGAYYAAQVVNPVFREIADRVYCSDLTIHPKRAMHLVRNTATPPTKLGCQKSRQLIYNNLRIKTSRTVGTDFRSTHNPVPTSQPVRADKQSMPSVLGMGLRDALFLLGNAGYQALVHGSGTVIQQSIHSSSSFASGTTTIRLTLE